MEKVRFKPLYLQVKENIFERIVAGEWPPGTFMPNEFALAEQYGVSQGTLRKALEELTNEKHLIRYQGKGTTVADLNEGSTVFPFYNLCDKSNKRLYPATRALFHEIITPTQELAEKLDINISDKVVYTERLRPIDEDSSEIVVSEVVYIPVKHFKKDTLENLTELPIRLYAFYISEFAMRVSTASEEMSVTLANSQDAKCFNIQENTPLLLVKRTSLDIHSRIIEYRESKVNSEKYTYKVTIN